MKLHRDSGLTIYAIIELIAEKFVKSLKKK